VGSEFVGEGANVVTDWGRIGGGGEDKRESG
jgi:hypothetical protein